MKFLKHNKYQIIPLFFKIILSMKIYFSLILIFSVSFCFAQDQAGFKDMKASNAKAKIVAKQQINDLHNGALLVRLKTGQNTINALIKSGQTDLAEKRKQKINEENLRIINAFKSEFNFCPVYFFYSNDSKLVSEGKFDEVKFIDEKLQVIDKFKFEFENFLIAEFGEVKGDTTKFYSHSTMQTTDHFSTEPQATYYGGGSTGAKGLIIKDKNFAQLRRPFPFFVKYPFFRKVTKQEIYTVRKMNKNLFIFLKNN